MEKKTQNTRSSCNKNKASYIPQNTFTLGTRGNWYNLKEMSHMTPNSSFFQIFNPIPQHLHLLIKANYICVWSLWISKLLDTESCDLVCRPLFNLYPYRIINLSCCAASTDLPDPLSPPISIVHWSREVFQYCCRAVVYRFQLVILLLHVHAKRSTSILLISLSLLLQQCPPCLVCLTWIVFMMDDRGLYNVQTWIYSKTIINLMKLNCQTNYSQLLFFFLWLPFTSAYFYFWRYFTSNKKWYIAFLIKKFLNEILSYMISSLVSHFSVVILSFLYFHSNFFAL